MRYTGKAEMSGPRMHWIISGLDRGFWGERILRVEWTLLLPEKCTEKKIDGLLEKEWKDKGMEAKKQKIKSHLR